MIIKREKKSSKRKSRVLRICSEWLSADDQNGLSENRFSSRITRRKCERAAIIRVLKEGGCFDLLGISDIELLLIKKEYLFKSS